jgi:hypothetical protein
MVESHEPRRDPIDLAGAFTLGAGVTALLFAVLHRAGPGSPGLLARAGLLVIAVAFLSFFVRLQARREHPLISLDLFTRAETAAPYLSGLLLGTTIYGVDTFVPLFVQGARGGSAGAAGAVVTPLVLGWSISAAVAARYIARAGALLILAGFAALGLAAGLGAGIAWISLACGLVGLGLGPSSLSQVLVIQHVVPEERRGIATSLVPFSRTVGGSLGVGALGGILASGLHRRLGLEADSASHFLEGGAATSPGLRLAIERSLLPVFGVLFVLAALNLLFAARYREGTDGAS